jgi:hypothetical protein
MKAVLLNIKKNSGPEVEGNMIIWLFDASLFIYHATGRNIKKA